MSGGSTRPHFQVSRSRELELRLGTGTRLGSALSGVSGRVRHIMLENLIIMLFKRHFENYIILPKIMPVSADYAKSTLEIFWSFSCPCANKLPPDVKNTVIFKF